jgi:hypothetical protein
LGITLLDGTPGAEKSKLHFDIMSAGTLKQALLIDYDFNTSFTGNVYSSSNTFSIYPAIPTQAANFALVNSGNTAYFGADNSTGSTFPGGIPYCTAIWSNSARPMRFATSGVERMRILDTGKIAVGNVFTPTFDFEVARNDTNAIFRVITLSGTANDAGAVIAAGASGTSYIQASAYNSGLLTLVGASHINSGFNIEATGPQPLVLKSNNTEGLRINQTGGQVLMGLTAPLGSAKVEIYTPSTALALYQSTAAGYVSFISAADNAGGFYYLQFQAAGVAVGAITSDSTTTTYATTSDYRLKKDAKRLTGALELLNKLNPVRFTWKSNGRAGQGFIAHELQEFFPEAVVGKKDGKDMQQIDVSKLVATLVAAVQELNSKVETLQ